MDEEKLSNWNKNRITILLLALNITGYLLCIQMGGIVYSVGSMDAEHVLIDHQYYRMLSAMFLHADIEHIVSNMIFLVGLGQMIEGTIGHIRFIVLYLLSGLCGSAFSIAHAIHSQTLYHSVGASGAIFGLIGALFVLVIIHHGTFQRISIKRILFAIVYMVYSGFSAQQIDNAAHIGGLLGGIIIIAVMNFIKVFVKREGTLGEN